MKRNPFVLLATMAASSFAVAAVIAVPAEVGTIQGAIDAAADGDEIQVAPGTYTGLIDFKGKAIRLIGVQGAAVTILDGEGIGPVVSFINGETGASELSGFTVRNGNGYGTLLGGGGVQVLSASPTIRHNVITGNVACSGAGLVLENGSPRVANNTISGNSQGDCVGTAGGGGMMVIGPGSAVVRDNLIEGNVVPTTGGGGIVILNATTPSIIGNVIRNNRSKAGGGIATYSDDGARIVNNLIVGNQASDGGGVWVYGASNIAGPRLVNNTIADNRAANGSQVYVVGFPGRAQFANNIVAGSSRVAVMECSTMNSSETPVLEFNDVYNAVGASSIGPCAGPLGGNFNLAVDPLFVGAPGSRKYRLQPASPLIDAGSNAAIVGTTTDLAGQPRVADGNNDSAAIVDLGAYEVQRAR